MEIKEYSVTDSNESLMELIRRVREAQKTFSSYTQQQTDHIFKAAAAAVNMQRLPLARLAVEETGMGIAEDKVIKNNYASEHIYNAYKDVKTCGIISRNESEGTMLEAEPVGLIAAVIPTTNPTSTAVFKTLISLKTRNGIILAPHPRAARSTIAAAKTVLEAAVEAGAPEGIIGWIDVPSVELTGMLMRESDLILATGGPGMVKAAYSSGKPAIGVGAGNVPAVIDKSADIKNAVSSIIHSKVFDNGVICASEQAVIAEECIYDDVKREFQVRGAYFLNDAEKDKLRSIMFRDGSLNAEIVGKSAVTIAELADICVPEQTKVLIGEVESAEPDEPFAREKLSPVLAMYRASDFEDSLSKAERLVTEGGYGHTSSIYIDEYKERERLEMFVHRMKTCRIVVNTPSSQGGIGDLYNFSLAPSMTLGCGTWGGNSVSDNVGVNNLLNFKTVAERRENMQWFRTPQRVYFKRGSLPAALTELKKAEGVKRVFVVTDRFLSRNGYTRCITDKLSELGIEYTVFSDVEPDPTLASAKAGAKAMEAFEPDCIIAFGGGSAMDAAKIMWVLYEYPDTDFMGMAMRFIDIRKRVYTFPKMGRKAKLVAVPTSSGTGSEVTPFAVITDEKTGIKYPLADYELMPYMAVIDADLAMSQPKSLTAASGIDALTHALEAYVSVMATDYTDGLALTAIKNIFRYLPSAYENGAADAQAREKMSDAASIAGMAFANAFLGICHSMAHKLGGFFHLPHGVANALLITEVMRYNISEAPQRMGTFSQYKYPRVLEKYAECAAYAGIEGSSDTELFEGLISRIEQLRTQTGILGSISEYGISEEEYLSVLDEMSEQAFDDQCTGANPRYPLISEIRQIYLNAFYSGGSKS